MVGIILLDSVYGCLGMSLARSGNKNLEVSMRYCARSMAKERPRGEVD